MLKLLRRYLATAPADDYDDDGQIVAPEDQVIVLLFLFTGLALGVGIQQFMTRTKSAIVNAVPYTVVMFLLGLGMAGYAQSLTSDDFNASLNEWIRIDADLMLFIFLPPLVFGEAMWLNWHHARMLAPASLMLAGPGVIIGTLLMGVFIKLIVPFPWLICFLIGSVLGSTDTVATLSIMHAAGASPKLTYLIVGESLLNDGSSMLLFEIFRELLKDPVLHFWPTMGYVFSMTLGSVALGIAIGLLTVICLRSVNRPLKPIDVESQVSITLISAYLAFYFAQHVLKISGILCIVSAAIMLAWLAPPIILNRETMHHIWGFIEWTFNTILFLLAGLIIGHKVLEKVGGADWGYMFCIFVLSNVTRSVVVAVLYPVTYVSGQRLAKNEAYFAAFASMRGALGMALGLIIRDTAEEYGIPAKVASKSFFYIGGTVALSLLVNGSLAQWMLNYLELGSNDSVHFLLIMDQIKRKLRYKMNRLVDKMEKELQVAPSDMNEVKMSVSILRPSQSEVSTLIAALNSHRPSPANSSSIGLSQRLTEAQLRAVANGTIDTAITPQSSNHNSRYSGSAVGADNDSDSDDSDQSDSDYDDDDASNKTAEFSYGSSNPDHSAPADDADSCADSWLNPDQIAAQKKRHQAKRSKAIALNTAEDSQQGLEQSSDRGQSSAVTPLTLSSSVDASTVGLPLMTNIRNNAYKSNEIDTAIYPNERANMSRHSTVDLSVTPVSHRPTSSSANSETHTTHDIEQHEPHASNDRQQMPELKAASNSHVFSADTRDALSKPSYDYTNDTAEVARRRMEQHQEATNRSSFGTPAGNRARTWSAASFLSTNRDGRSSRYSKGSAAGGGRSHRSETRASRYSNISTMLDPSRRKSNRVIPEILAYVRTLFLEIVRMKYWKLIEGGKLPRHNHSSGFLLYSVDVGIDAATFNPTRALPTQGGLPSRGPSFASTVAEEDGLADWSCIERDLNKSNMFGRKTLMWWEAHTPYWLGRDIASYALEVLESEHENRLVYMLTAFIEAHEHAQRKIHSFVNVDVDESEANANAPDAGGRSSVGTAVQPEIRQRQRLYTDESAEIYERTPEEIQVKNESARVVAKAKQALECIEEEVRAEIRAKQAAMTILAKEVALVKELNEEGLLNDCYAETFLEEIQQDREGVEKDQSGLFRRRRGRKQEQLRDEGGGEVFTPLMTETE